MPKTLSSSDGTTAAPQPPRPRLVYLDGVRGLAALFVVFHHMWQKCFDAPVIKKFPFWWHATTIFSWGHYAVGVFIVLSGFCLMLPVARSGKGRLLGGVPAYLKRRARRILPPYYVALALSWAMLALLPSLRQERGDLYDLYHRPTMVAALLSHLFLLHNLVPGWTFRFDPPMWSVATEWQIYFLFPLLLLPLQRRFGLVAPVIAGIALGAASISLHLGLACFWFIGLFALGMGSAVICFSPSTSEMLKRMPWTGLWLAFSGATIIGLIVAKKTMDAYAPFADLLDGLATACLLTACTLQYIAKTSGPWSLPLRLLSNRGVVWLGTFSYSVYLIHYPLVAAFQLVLQQHSLTAPQDFLVQTGVGLPILLAVSFLFHLAFERPFMNMPRGKSGAAVVSRAT